MFRVEYETQRLSLRFFMMMLVLFFLQTGLGLLLSAQHLDPMLLAGTLNFNVIRSQHLNLAIFWVLSGFIATILFVGPLLSKRELAEPWLIKVLFYALLAVVLWNAGTQVLAQQGISGWFMGEPLLQEGLEYLEAGRVADVVILIGFAILCFVVLRTFPPRAEWNEIHWALGLGVVALTLVWVFGMVFIERLDLVSEGAPFRDMRDDGWSAFLSAQVAAAAGRNGFAIEYDCAVAVFVDDREVARGENPDGPKRLDVAFDHAGGEAALRIEARDTGGPFLLRWVD